MKKVVSFDFDNTLSRKDVQEYAKELIALDIDVWVVTARYDDLHAHLYDFRSNHDDLWVVVDELNIPRWRVRFMNMNFKAEFLTNTRIIWHLDDDVIELMEIRNAHIPTIGIQVNSGSWKSKCNRLLNSKKDETQTTTIKNQGI